ncbi:pancreatic triacylglycerol lipase-like [Agrilus planipennis]|uniref:Pancreatic triacylglycerol lipase-like n=1 Tax=Agrilus planipennis TaxID=224129 RepID=A0A1W4X7Q4_AGRPL|nr:pancreatic triacylglycerol lipase-like [Agrilus planipennis]
MTSKTRILLLIPFIFGVLPVRVTAEGVLITTENITAYLYTRANPDTPDFLHTNDLSDLRQSHFNSSLPNYIVFHGSVDNYLSSMYIKEPLLDVADVNLFLVDYSGPASNLTWRTQAIEDTGRIVTDYIQLILTEYSIDLHSITLVGFSMGTHICGQIGKLFNGNLDTIVALDPGDRPPIVIGSSRARYVHVIHTSITGIQTPVGHADYYANTNDQPGCNGNETCNHFRSTRFYAESLSTGGFTAVKCDSRESFVAGLCNGNEKSHLGGIILDRRYVRYCFIFICTVYNTRRSNFYARERLI